MSTDEKISVLIVEDDRRLNYINRHALESEGYAVETAYALDEARCALKSIFPDVILLDVKLPDGNGFDLCREIRETTAAHIIFLTSVTESSGEMEGLTAGGNDYLRKPYSIELLLKRVENAILLRDKKEQPPQTVKRGSLTLDIIACQAFMEGNDLLLSQKEFAILLLLIQNEGKTLSAETVYENVWGQPMSSDKNALQTAVYRLRKKIEHTGYDIMTERRKGYSFEKA